MARCTVRLPEEFLKRLSSLGERTDEVASKALQAGGEIILAEARENLRRSVGSGTKYPSRSTGQLESSLGLSKARVDRNGDHNVKIGFSEGRGGGGSNAAVANVLEYGKHGQPAKPFLAPAKKKAGREALEAMKRTIEEEAKK